MSSSAPAAAYLATRALPSSTTSGGVLHIAPLLWRHSSGAILCFSPLKRGWAPSPTLGGGWPPRTQRVRGPLSLLVGPAPPPQAAATIAVASARVLTHTFLTFIRSN